MKSAPPPAPAPELPELKKLVEDQRMAMGGALSTVRAQCGRSATIWASGRTRDPYFEILGAPRGIMVTPSGGFDFGFCPPMFGDPRECKGDVAFPPSFGPQPSGAIEETGTIFESTL